MKRTFALLLALVMVIGMMPLSVFAEETTVSTISVTTDAADLTVGDQFAVTVSISDNTGFASMILGLTWNSDVVKFTGFETEYDEEEEVYVLKDTILGQLVEYNEANATVGNARTSNTKKNGTIFIGNFEVVGYGDCGIAIRSENFELVDLDEVPLNPNFDLSSVENLTVAAPHVCEYVDNVLAEPTCTGSGSVMRECACGNVIIESIPALGHEFVEGTCTRCGEADPDYTAPHEHSYEAVVTAPTCTEGGYTTYTCACGDTYTADETEALGHNYVNGACEVCGEANPEAVTYAWYGDGTSVSYTISTAEELHQFAAIVNGTDANYPLDDFSGKTVSLANDIALAEDGLYIVNEDVAYGTSSWPLTIDQFVLKEEAPVWTPIGTGTSSGNGVVIGTSFAGTFDGNGYTISGVYTGTKDATTCNTVGVQGLFGVVTGTIKNLTVSGCITGTTVIGGVAAYLNGGTIENCVNNALVFGDGGNKPATGKEEGTSRAGAVGGIVGRAAGTGSVTGCVNNGHIVCANSNQGGRVAGIIGLIDGSGDAITTSQNVNNGTIEGYQYVAGIVGMVYSTKSPTDSCINNGDIFGYGTNKTHVGGIVGQYASTVSNCYNTGDVTVPSGANGYAGLIVGDYSYGVANPTITNCYATGNMNGGSQHIGIITGCGKSENCYYLDSATVQTNSDEQGSPVAKTAEELKSAEMVALLNGETGTAWKMDGTCVSVNDGYPVLAWQACADHIFTDATCTDPMTCTVCGETEGEALGHAYEAAVTDPDCTNGGYTTYTCAVCGDSYVADEVAANGHSYEAVVTDPTCTEDGYTTYTCADCGDSYVADEIAALYHDYRELLVDPTCTEQGYTIRKCVDCGHTYNTSYVDALGHTDSDAVVENQVAATCTADAYHDEVVYCAVCAAEVSRLTVTEEGTALGHTWIGGTCTVCGVSNENADKYAWYEAGSETASYTISTAEELAQFAAIVNGTDANYPLDNFSGKTVSLANDIALAADGLYIANENITYGSKSYPLTTTQYVLAEEAPVWTPIGTGTATSTYNNVTTSTAFAGTFDGNGYTISGVYTGTKDASAPNTASVQGLFGIVTGTVKNLTVSGCVTGRSVVGGVVAYLNGGTIENCVNNAIVFSDGGNKIGSETGGSGAGATGGIVGRAGGVASVTGCVNNATVICANSNKGGRVAGIIGLIDATGDEVTVERNANYGDVTGYQYVAGIVGLNYSSKSPITSCLNTGDIHCWGAQKLHVGGIVGQFNSPVADCYVTGDVYAYWTARTAYVGGIAGDRTTYSGTAGNALTVNNCYFTGSIFYTTNDSIASMGMIAGDVSANSVNNYYLDEGFAASSAHKGTVSTSYSTAMTADELKAATDLLNGETGTAWKADGTCQSINGGFPILSWQTGAADHAFADATCTDPMTCTVCGETEGEALGHEYESVVTDPTCMEKGYTTYICGRCGDSYVDEDSYVGATGHCYKEWTVEPTCTEQGYTHRECIDCGNTYDFNYVEALGHDFADGTCGRCGEADPDYHEHDYVAVVTEPTCTEAGYTTYTCACGDSYTADETAALGHDYVDGICGRCGEADPDYEEPSNDNSWSSWWDKWFGSWWGNKDEEEDPTDPTDPSEPVEPSEPTEPSEPETSEPTEPSEPEEDTKPGWGGWFDWIWNFFG